MASIKISELHPAELEQAGAQGSPADGIRELTVEELAAVSGGGLWGPIIKFVRDYVIGKGIDYAVDHKAELYDASHHYGLNGHNPSPY